MSELRGIPNVAEKQELLKKSLPRFLWRAIAYSGKTRRYEAIFDATDVAASEQLLLFSLVYTI